MPTLHTNIHFTLEIGFNRINFLLLTLTFDNNKMSIEIYRKETQIVAIISESSNHLACPKFAALNSYIHRILNLPLSRDSFNKVLEIIEYIGLENGHN